MPTTPTPQVFEPRERAAAAAVAVIATSVLLWCTYLLAVSESWLLKALILGSAVVASTSAVTICCRYIEQKANSREHQAVLNELAEVRDDHRRVIAAVQQLAQRPYDWSAYAEGMRDAVPPTGTDALATVTPIRSPHGQRPE